LSTYRSPLYRLWVFGGLVAVVAFTVIGGLSDPTNQDFVLYLIPVIAFWVAGILFLQWRGVKRDERGDEGAAAKAAAPLTGWSVRYAAVLCLAIFVGVFLFYAGVDSTLYPLGGSGPGFPLVLLPAIVLVLYGVGHTLRLLRELTR
jgi:peptidoglycan/LPS O-acetylase OafA/YrhL